MRAIVCLMDADSLSERMAETARHLQDSHDDMQETFQSAVDVAQSHVDGCDAVGLTFVTRKQHVKTVAVTDGMALTADELQYTLGEGPCLDAVWEQQAVRSPNLEHDQRWPSWGPRVVRETSAQSIMSFQLFTHQDLLGALNLYSTSRDAFDDPAFVEGLVIAAHVSIAVAAAQQVDNLTQGIASRTVIGQATGILMERYDLDAARAFTVMTRMSSQANIKLRNLAQQIVDNRATSAVP